LKPTQINHGTNLVHIETAVRLFKLHSAKKYFASSNFIKSFAFTKSYLFFYAAIVVLKVSDNYHILSSSAVWGL